MGFFDFLGQQEPTPSRSRILTKPQQMDRLPDAVEGEAQAADLSKLDGGSQAQGDEFRRAFLDKEQGVIREEATALRKIHDTLRLVTTPDTDAMSPEASDPQILQVKDALDRGMLKPHQLMDDLQTILKKSKNFQTPGLTQSLSSSLNDLRAAAQKRQAIEAERLNVKDRPQSRPGDYSAGADEAFGKAQSLRDDARNRGVLAGQDIERQAKNFEAQGASLRTQADEEAAANAPKMLPALAAPTSSPETQTTSKEYDKRFNGMNLPREERVKAMLDIVDKHGLDLDQDVDFKTGVWQLLQDEFPEEIPSFIQYAMGQRPKSPEQALAEGAAPMPAQQPSAAQEASQMDGQHAMQPTTTNDPIEGKKQELRQRQMELADAQELQSWPAIIAFALLSVILKPQGAFLFFSNAKKKGELQYLINDIKDDIRWLRHTRDMKEKEQTDYRKMYVQQALQGKRQDDSQNKAFRQQILLTSMRGAQQLKAAKARAGNDDAILKGLEASFSQATNLSGRYAATAEFDKANEWNKKAESIVQLISKRRAQVEQSKQAQQTQQSIAAP